MSKCLPEAKQKIGAMIANIFDSFRRQGVRFRLPDRPSSFQELIAILRTESFPATSQVQTIRKSSVNGHANRLLAIRVLLLPLLIIFVAGCSSPKSSVNRFNLTKTIPNGETTVEVLEIRYSERVEELSIKMSKALAANQDWWTEYIKQHASDYPLPYHTNIGLTHAEYTEYLAEASKTRHLHKVADANVVFGRQENLISIDLGDENSPVTKWRLNALTGDLFLPIGKAIKPVWVTGEDATQPIGAFEGYRWNYESAAETPSDCNIASLDIYRQKPSGLIFWRVKEGKIENNRCIRSLDISFQYSPNVAGR